MPVDTVGLALINRRGRVSILGVRRKNAYRPKMGRIHAIPIHTGVISKDLFVEHGVHGHIEREAMGTNSSKF